MNAVLYVLQFAGATVITQVKRIVKAFLSLYRAYYCIGCYTASAVIFNKHLEGGLPSLRQQLRLRKENKWYRLRKEGGRVAAAVETLVIRLGHWSEHCHESVIYQHDLSASGGTFCFRVI